MNKNNNTSLVNAYKELKESRMVLAEKHISKLLKIVAENDLIYNIIAERIVGYEFSSNLALVLNGGRDIEDLSQTEEIIPFSFCLLNEIDNQSIKTVAFIRQVYNNDSEECFKLFCEQFIAPFVNQISILLGGKDDQSVNDEEDFSISIEKVFESGLDERVRYVVATISDKILLLKKVKKEVKKDLDIICYSIDLSLELGQFIGIFGLLCGLKNLLMQLKKFKSEVDEINLILESFNNL